jgi:hypothetical protein
MAPNNGSNNEALNETHSTLLKSLVSGISAWFLFLLSGGVVFTVYYARIGYLPDIEWNSALSYLAAASMVGGGLLITLSLLLIAPGLIWTTYLTRSDTLKKAFCHGSRNAQLTHRKLLARLVLWLFLFSVITHLYLISHRQWLLVVFVIVSVIKVLSIIFFESKDIQVNGAVERFEQIVVYVFWYGVSIAAMTGATYVLFYLLGLKNPPHYRTQSLICTLGLAVASFVVTLFLHDRKISKAFGAALVFALTFVIIDDAFKPVPNEILRNYGFGAHVRLIVNEDVYRTLKEEQVVTDDPKPGVNTISDVTMWCRMGQNYFLENRHRKFTLRKSDVLSWSVEDQR